MNSEKAIFWIQLSAALAVMLGLGLVIWELRQAHQLARAQLISDGFLAELEDTRALLGENPTEVIMKGCLTPDELTPAEWKTNQAYMSLFTIRNERNFYLSQLDNLGRDSEISTTLSLRRLLGIPLFRRWYEQNKPGIPPRIKNVAERIISNGTEIPCNGLAGEQHLKDLQERSAR
jgi:hypothetical protein